MTTLGDRITADRISTRCERRDKPSYGFDGDWWTVTLARGGRRFQVAFGMGYGHGGAAPTADDVLECLLSDAAGIENARSFEDWAAEYGYDDDSRDAERIYRQVARITERLHRWLGDDFDAYVWETRS